MRIVAENGKIFRRKSDGFTGYGKEINLGYTYYLNGEKLEEPHLEVPEDFEQIDAPVEQIIEEIGEEYAFN